MTGKADTVGLGSDGKANSLTYALSKGYVVAAPGARGRTLTDNKGNYTGKAPAAIVDLKAAVRYLYLNDEVMPGAVSYTHLDVYKRQLLLDKHSLKVKQPILFLENLIISRAQQLLMDFL